MNNSRDDNKPLKPNLSRFGSQLTTPGGNYSSNVSSIEKIYEHDWDELMKVKKMVNEPYYHSGIQKSVENIFAF